MPWQKLISKSTGKAYYFDPSSKASVWHDDALPPGWAWGRDGEAGLKWYINLYTSQKQLTLPTAPAAANKVASAPAAPASAAAPAVSAAAPVASVTASGVQLSYIASKTAADDLLSTAYIPDEASKGANVPASVVSKRDYLFGSVDASIRWKLQVDEVALYSITEAREAKKQAELLSDYISPLSTVTDATACVGGNTIAFGRVFKHVHGVELSEQRAHMLEHNVRTVGLDASRVTVHQGDYVSRHMLALRQDAVFFDPPWGGPDYHKAAALDMFLGDHDVADIIALLTSARQDAPVAPAITAGAVMSSKPCPYARLVMLKAPLNYNVQGLRAALERHGTGATVALREDSRKMMILLIKAAEAPKPITLGVGTATANTPMAHLVKTARGVVSASSAAAPDGLLKKRLREDDDGAGSVSLPEQKRQRTDA